ncbi:MAG: ribonuclease HII [Alphaproteobacteria bacterium]|nr:ribonuclease HII [Alphaproteobacteria bacterium]
MPDFSHEQHIISLHGARLVAGVDEVGRGPLAGPVVACALAFPGLIISDGLRDMIKDSKALNIRNREKAYKLIIESGAVFALAACSAQVIDDINILRATMRAMTAAAGKIDADWFLIDGNRAPPSLKPRAAAVVKGDRQSLSIAAASIVAKVTRDRLMGRLAALYPFYGWDRNAGYGTGAHLSAIEKHGITAHHRKTFRPLTK